MEMFEILDALELGFETKNHANLEIWRKPRPFYYLFITWSRLVKVFENWMIPKPDWDDMSEIQTNSDFRLILNLNLFSGPSKPGTARKMMGSPRQLENAVPTSKNPHGVWV